MTDSYRGSCLCGAVRFEIDEFLSEAAHCHCSMCRKFHGAAFATFASVHRSKFRWLSGTDSLERYTAVNGTMRGFCRHCGSSLTFFSPRAPEELVEVALGAMDTDVPVKPNAHIFMGAAANWTVVEDGLPQYEEHRGGARMKLAAEAKTRRVREVIGELSKQVERADDLDPDSRVKMEALYRELERVGHAGDAEIRSWRDRAKELEAQFAIRHPTLERIARDLADAIAKLGV